MVSGIGSDSEMMVILSRRNRTNMGSPMYTATPTASLDIRKRRDVFALEAVFGVLLFSVIVIVLLGYIAHKDVLSVATLAILWVFSLPQAKVVLPLHEGSHVIVAHWLGVPGKQIGARGTRAYTSKVSKPIWVKITLAPLLLPLFVFALLVPLDWRLAIARRTSAAFGLGHRRFAQFLIVLQPHQRIGVLQVSKNIQKVPVSVATVCGNHFGARIPSCQSLHLFRGQFRIRTLGADPPHIHRRYPGCA